MALLVSPVLHKLPVKAEEINVTKLLPHNKVEPLIETVGAVGKGFTVTSTPIEVAEVQPPRTLLNV